MFGVYPLPYLGLRLFSCCFLSKSHNDRLIGRRGNDLLRGQAGNDTLTGELGTDRFRFLQPNHGVENITDFLSADQFILGTSAQDSSDRFIYNQNVGNLFYDADGVDGNNQILLATLFNQADLVANDILTLPRISGRGILASLDAR